jgi:hypothetical protein
VRLAIEGIIDAGIPNKERLNLRVVEVADLSYYCVLNTRASGNLVQAGSRDAFWFPLAAVVKPGDLVVLYTGFGTQTFLSRGLNTDYFFYSSKSETLWGDPEARVVLLEMLTWQSNQPALATELQRSLGSPPSKPSS